MSIHRCVFCREEFEVLYPELWAYRLPGSNSFFCSWRCLRADEKRGRDKKMSGAVRKITPEMEKKAAQIAIDGGDPRPYLRDECGSKNPVALWGHIRQKLRDQDPETFGRLPGSLKRKAAEKTEDAPAEEAKDTPAAEAEKDTGAAAAEDEYTTSAIRHTLLGEFYYDEKHGCMDWRAPDGAEARMAPGTWRKLAREIPVILKRLGVRA